MEGWVNVDASPDVKADIHLDVAEFVRQYGDQVDEVYMGHVIEHLMPGYALTTASAAQRAAAPGCGRVRGDAGHGRRSSRPTRPARSTMTS